MTSQHGQHGKPAAPKFHCLSGFCKFQLDMDFGCRGWGGVFGIIKQIWHLCGVANMIVYPSWSLSPSGYALGWQCSLGVDNHVGNPTEMSYLYNYNTVPYFDCVNVTPWLWQKYESYSYIWWLKGILKIRCVWLFVAPRYLTSFGRIEHKLSAGWAVVALIEDHHTHSDLGEGGQVADDATDHALRYSGRRGWQELHRHLATLTHWRQSRRHREVLDENVLLPHVAFTLGGFEILNLENTRK